MQKVLGISLAAALLAGCATTSATPVARNQVLISASAAPVCRGAGATRVASRMAAVETIRNGFARFIIQGAQSRSDVRVVNRPPTGAYTTGTFQTYGGTTTGTMRTTFTGGGPMVFGGHDSQLLVLMLNPGDPGFDNAVDARQVLGPDWEAIVQRGIRTC